MAVFRQSGGGLFFSEFAGILLDAAFGLSLSNGEWASTSSARTPNRTVW